VAGIVPCYVGFGLGDRKGIRGPSSPLQPGMASNGNGQSGRKSFGRRDLMVEADIIKAELHGFRGL
jgi:hypothetical protein